MSEITLPKTIRTTGTVRCTDGIASDVEFEFELDDLDTIVSYIADRAKVAWRSKVATKNTRVETGKDAEGKPVYKNKEERLLTIDEVENMGLIRVKVSEFAAQKRGPRQVTESQLFAAVDNMSPEMIKKLIERMSKRAST